jgi:DNA-binding transcriptional LysR family regulator
MELKQLRALREIVETGSFSVAAERLRLTQSALSHQIKNLESELGETLLIRGKPRVMPSEAGRMVLASAERILAEVGAIGEHFRAADKGPAKGTLRVAATNFGMVYLYGRLCEAFMTRHPGIEMAFRATETPEEAARRVEGGEADVAFIPFLSPHPLLETVALGTTEDVFIVGRSHPLARRRTVTLDELRQSRFVRFHPNSGSRTVSDRLFADGGYPPIAAESNDAEFVKRMVGMGVGAALIPVIAVAREAQTKSLRLLRLRDHPIAMEFGMVHRRGLHMRAVALLKAFALEMRGPELRHLTIETVGRQPFGH